MFILKKNISDNNTKLLSDFSFLNEEKKNKTPTFDPATRFTTCWRWGRRSMQTYKHIYSYIKAFRRLEMKKKETPPGTSIGT